MPQHNSELLLQLVDITLKDAREVCVDLMERGIVARTPTEMISIALGIIASDALAQQAKELELKGVAN